MFQPLLALATGSLSFSVVPGACPGAIAEIAQAQARVCLASSFGIAVADNPERAGDLLAWADDGAARVATRLAIIPSRYAVFDGPGGEVAAPVRESLAAQGFPVVLNWLSPQAFQRQMEDNVARTIRQRMAASGVDGARLEAIVAGAVAQVAGQTDAAAIRTRDSVVVPHELGHKWLGQAFWPDAGRVAGQYGGPAPDWLEEMVALLAEPDHSLAERREQFWQAYRNDRAAGRKPGFDDLAGFLAAPHPMSNQLGAESPHGGGGFSVRVMDSNDPGLAGVNPGHYYLQALIFYDFLNAFGLGAEDLHSLVLAASEGRTFDAWLQENGSDIGLPQSEADLDRQWRDWLENAAPA